MERFGQLGDVTRRLTRRVGPRLPLQIRWDDDCEGHLASSRSVTAGDELMKAGVRRGAPR